MNIYTGSRYTGSSRAWYLFSHEHDIIETGPKFLEQKGNVWYIVQLTMRSTLVYYDICPPIARMCSRFCPHLPSLFLLFRVFRYAHAQLRTLCDLYLTLLTWEKIPGFLRLVPALMFVFWKLGNFLAYVLYYWKASDFICAPVSLPNQWPWCLGLGTRLHVCMCTRLENGVLRNRQQPDSGCEQLYWPR